MSENYRWRKSYQSVDDVGDDSRSGNDRTYLNDVVFSGDAAGQSLLDVGCNLGFFCREAARRGVQATGIDTDPEVIGSAASLAQGLAPEPEFICGDFEEWSFGERKFDLVIALNVLHHMFDPIHVLRRIQSLARRRIVLEVAQPTWRDRKLVLRSPSVFLARGMPVIWLDYARMPRRVGSRTFLFTRTALSVLFNEHTNAFEPLRFHSSPFKGRLIVEARRRDIGHLVVVAGPTSSGKSTFQNRFMRDAGFRKAYVGDDGEWIATNGSKVAQLPVGRLDRVLLHYDLLRPLGGSLKTHERDPSLDVLNVAEQVTIITIACEPNRLVRQIENGELTRWKRRRHHVRLRKLYGSDDFLVQWYQSWFRFCTKLTTPHMILVENKGEFVERPLDTWQEIIRGRRHA